MSVMFCDTNCELWFTLADELKLHIIGMPYFIDDESKDYDLGRNTNFKEFYNKIRNGAMPLTQALNPQNYIDYFEPHLKKGNDILYLHFSHKLSATFDFMQKAIKELKKKYPEQNIKTVDTLSISIGASAIIYEAAKLHNSGTSDDEIIKFVESSRDKYKAYFVVDNLNHLKRGGRISSTKALVGTVLGVKPILTINKDGVIEAVDKAKGKKKAITALVDRLKSEGENLKDHPIIIAHADAEKEANIIADKVKEYVGQDANIWIQPIGPTIGSHCGPGTFAVSFHTDMK